MDKQLKLQALRRAFELVSELKKDDQPVSLEVAKALGWEILADPEGEMTPYILGVHPITLQQELIPHFTGSYDAAVSTIPEYWVESYQRRFDGFTKADCTPRGDLPIKRMVFGEAPTPVLAILSVGLLAQIQMLED